VWTGSGHCTCCRIAHSFRYSGSIAHTNPDSNLGTHCNENGDDQIYRHSDEYTYGDRRSNPDPEALTESVARRFAHTHRLLRKCNQQL
jgi:hypothetical protein